MIRQRVLSILASVLGVSETDLHEDSSTESLESWDSVRHLDVILAIEEEFDTEFDETAIAELTSVGAIVDRLGGGAEQARR